MSLYLLPFNYVFKVVHEGSGQYWWDGWSLRKAFWLFVELVGLAVVLINNFYRFLGICQPIQLSMVGHRRVCFSSGSFHGIFPIILQTSKENVLSFLLIFRLSKPSIRWVKGNLHVRKDKKSHQRVNFLLLIVSACNLKMEVEQFFNFISIRSWFFLMFRFLPKLKFSYKNLAFSCNAAWSLGAIYIWSHGSFTKSFKLWYNWIHVCCPLVKSFSFIEFIMLACYSLVGSFTLLQCSSLSVTIIVSAFIWITLSRFLYCNVLCLILVWFSSSLFQSWSGLHVLCHISWCWAFLRSWWSILQLFLCQPV